MGTHPIFESDFDCLTDFCIISNPKMVNQKYDPFRNSDGETGHSADESINVNMTEEEDVPKQHSADASFVETIKEAATPPRLLTLGIKWGVFVICVLGIVLFGFRKRLFPSSYYLPPESVEPNFD